MIVSCYFGENSAYLHKAYNRCANRFERNVEEGVAVFLKERREAVTPSFLNQTTDL